MKANDLSAGLIICAVYLTVDLQQDERDVADYIDAIPEFLLTAYDYDATDDHYNLLDQFLEWITARDWL